MPPPPNDPVTTKIVASGRGGPAAPDVYNVASDEHAVSVLWMASPLVAMDTYEHAFYVDYENRKAEYIENFVEHIDWQAVQNGSI